MFRLLTDSSSSLALPNTCHVSSKRGDININAWGSVQNVLIIFVRFLPNEYKLNVSRRLGSISPRASSHVTWVNGKYTEVSSTICFVFIRELRCGPRNFGAFANRPSDPNSRPRTLYRNLNLLETFHHEYLTWMFTEICPSRINSREDWHPERRREVRKLTVAFPTYLIKVP